VSETQWTLPFGANVERDGTRFRIWAPDAKEVAVAIEGDAPATHPMQRGAGGYHHAHVAGVGDGTRYRFVLDGNAVPDPASRSQPDGVTSASQVVDPHAFAWSDDDWNGVALEQLVIYELHIGTFTSMGTFDAAIPRLDDLVALGVTAIEIMPIADFAGTRNWGYDGVALFAPAAVYGGAAGFKRLVDAAHRRGLAVILDVVYNHLGPEGNFLPAISGGRFFNPRHQTPWGDAVNYDGPSSAAVRDFVVHNALYWAHEYHVDGLRLDAAHAIIDDSPVHIIREITDRLHALPRPRLIVAEDDRNERRLVLPANAGGLGLDAVWADDLHHQLRRFVSGDRDSYFASYRGTIADIVATLRRGWFFEGQWSEHHGAPRGTSASGLPPRAFVHCLQNHDQVGNRPFGDRLHESMTLAEYRVLSAVLLLSPYTPMLFMGQEWAASSPFQFFTDFPRELGALVTAGRRQEFAGFSAYRDSGEHGEIPDPQADDTFLRSRLQWSERGRAPHAQILALYRELLALRATLPALRARERDSFVVGVLHDRALAIRREGPDGSVVLLLAQFGDATHQLAANHSLLASPAGHDWAVQLCTQDRRFGGGGSHSGLSNSGTLTIQGVDAIVLATRPAAADR
jgi:maltooligosyltrehalose trehalohydrolase